MKIDEKRVLRTLAILFSVSVVTLSIFGDKGLLELKQLKKVESDLALEIQQLKLESLEWQEKVKSLKTNRTYLEVLAREELGMIKPDEISIEFGNENKKP